MVYPAGWTTKLQSALALTINLCCTYVLHSGALALLGPLKEIWLYGHADLLDAEGHGNKEEEEARWDLWDGAWQREINRIQKREIWKSCSISGEQLQQSKFLKAALALAEPQNKWAHFHFWVSVTYLDASLETELSGKSVLNGGCWALGNLACSFSQCVLHLF